MSHLCRDYQKERTEKLQRKNRDAMNALEMAVMEEQANRYEFTKVALVSDESLCRDCRDMFDDQSICTESEIVNESCASVTSCKIRNCTANASLVFCDDHLGASSFF